mmetsp:Transcript_52528/g.163066  ORF Transcript_52528/g.163066 Transcript_52528/m.163066 type:complete len:284 (+) Transcript_52528:630-1481(+)
MQAPRAGLRRPDVGHRRPRRPEAAAARGEVRPRAGVPRILPAHERPGRPQRREIRAGRRGPHRPVVHRGRRRGRGLRAHRQALRGQHPRGELLEARQGQVPRPGQGHGLLPGHARRGRLHGARLRHVVPDQVHAGQVPGAPEAGDYVRVGRGYPHQRLQLSVRRQGRLLGRPRHEGRRPLPPGRQAGHRRARGGQGAEQGRGARGARSGVPAERHDRQAGREGHRRPPGQLHALRPEVPLQQLGAVPRLGDRGRPPAQVRDRAEQVGVPCQGEEDPPGGPRAW